VSLASEGCPLGRTTTVTLDVVTGGDALTIASAEFSDSLLTFSSDAKTYLVLGEPPAASAPSVSSSSLNTTSTQTDAVLESPPGQ
jgi:hypothetical protein